VSSWCCGMFFGGCMAKKDPSFRQNKRTVSCMICQAIYAPSQLRSDLLQASPLVLESTFMSMCHFCFRCRRLSCPDCWDDVHGLCASCDLEARLPLRAELPPLYGTLLPPQRQAQIQPPSTVASPLLLVRPGAYGQEQPLPIDKITTRPESYLPLPTKTLSPAPSSITKNIPRTTSKSSLPVQPKIPSPRKQAPTALKQLGRITIWLLSLVLLGMIILTTVALLSAEVNATILAVLHVDIRREIAPLWQFLRQLFS
jgi:hypothetical protein